MSSKQIINDAYALHRKLIVVTASIAIWSQFSSAEDLLELSEAAGSSYARFLSANHKYLSAKELAVLSRGDLLPAISLQYERKETDQKIDLSDNTAFASGSDRYPTNTYGIELTPVGFRLRPPGRFERSIMIGDLSAVELTFARQDLFLRFAESYFSGARAYRSAG